MTTDLPSDPIQLEGYRAYQARQGISMNPYPWAEQAKCQAWARGHAWARTDHARDLRRTTTPTGETA